MIKGRLATIAAVVLTLSETTECRAGTAVREWAYRVAPPSGMTRAELHFRNITTNSSPAGVLVLSPGMNGDGGPLLSDTGWVEFAKRCNLLMVGLSFASKIEDLHNGSGYYYADKGSGRILLKGLKDAKVDSLPLYLYGFSGGAHFTSRFVMWCPRKVKAWCAYSAAWWDEPLIGKSLPPGIVACGESDFRVDPSRKYFEGGRDIGAKWLWICLRDTGHTSAPGLEDFFRRYVESLSRIGEHATGVWINMHLGREETPDFVKRFPCAVGWLPEGGLLAEWARLRGLRP